MKKLSIRKRGIGVYEVGGAGHSKLVNGVGRTQSVMVNALDKSAALQKGRAILRKRVG